MDYFLCLETVPKGAGLYPTDDGDSSLLIKHSIEWKNNARILKWFEENLESIRHQTDTDSHVKVKASQVCYGVLYIVTKDELGRLIRDCQTALEHKDMDRLAANTYADERSPEREEILRQLRASIEEALQISLCKGDCWVWLKNQIDKLQIILRETDWDNEILMIHCSQIEERYD